MTSILKLLPKSLEQYAADQMLKWCIDNWEFLGSRSDEQAFRGSRYRWRDHAELRGHVGDGVHNYIEALQTGAWEFPEVGEEEQQILDNWEELNAIHEIVPLRNEVTVGDTDLGWMGTYDSYCLLDGKRTMVDFKTSKNVYDSAFMQVAALCNAKEWYIEVEDMKWEIIEPEPIEQAAVFHLRADKWAIVTLNDIDLHFEKFKRYAEIWQLNETLKKIEKERDAA